MGELTIATGKEVALLRVGGKHILRLGEVGKVSFAKASRILAHTHPSGILMFSQSDVRLLNRLNQARSVLIAPGGKARALDARFIDLTDKAKEILIRQRELFEEAVQAF